MAITGPIDGSAPRARLDAHWVTNLSVADAKRRLREIAVAWGWRLISESDSEMLFDQGSQVRTRALGAWLADPKHFPKRSIVDFRAADGGTIVDATVYETLGFAIFDSISKRRYEDYFGAWIDTLKRTLTPAAPTASRSLDQLERFARLRDKGVITDEEFITEKKRILG